MNIKPLLQKISFLCLLFFITSCVNLKKINDYASASNKNIEKFEELGHSFAKACNDKCVIEQLEKQQLNKSCDCKKSNEADSVTLVLYNAVKGYFDGLAKLSNKEATSYKFDTLAKVLKEGNFGDVKINKDHVDAYTKIGSILTKAVTDGYRKRKLTQYIEEANEPMKVLLNALQFTLVSNLAQTLETKIERVKSYYFDLFEDQKASEYEKKKIVEDFNTAISDIDTKKKQMIAFGRGLNTIAQGHQVLFENRNKLTDKELKESLSQYFSDIQNIVNEINKLKKQD